MNTGRSLQAGDRSHALDGEGYLLDFSSWTPEVAETMAKIDGLALTDEHWRIIRLLREYFAEYEIAPPMRALVGLLRERLGDERIESRMLYRLFPEGPAKQACRYAGLPRPVSCI